MTMTNEFDQFDAPSSGGNVFDQFDEKPQKQPWSMSDIAKSGASGLVRGAAALPELAAMAPGLLKAPVDWAFNKMGAPPMDPDIRAPNIIPSPSSVAGAFNAVEDPILHKPESTAGEYANTVGEFLGNPLTYTGAGSLAGKLATGATSALGSEALGQAAEGTSAELPARIAGAVLGAKAPRTAARLATPLPITPERQAAVNVLRQGYKDPITGEIIGSTEPAAGDVTGSRLVKMNESTLGTALGSGNKYLAAKEAAERSFTKYAANAMGQKADLLKPEVFQQARSTIGPKIENAAQRLNVVFDKPLNDQLSAITKDMMDEGFYDATVHPEVSRIQSQIDNVMSKFVSESTSNGSTRHMMDGDNYHGLIKMNSSLDRAVEDSNPTISYYAQRIKDAVNDAAQRSANRPGTRPGVGVRQALADMQDARRQWANMKVLESVVTRPGEGAAAGLVSPQRLRAALLTNGGGDRRMLYALAKSDLGKWARAGEEIMTPVNSSMTTERGLVAHIPQMLAQGTIGGVAGYGVGETQGHPYTGAIAGALSTGLAGRALMSKPMQSYLKNQKFAPYLATQQPRASVYGRPLAGTVPSVPADDQHRATGGRAMADGGDPFAVPDTGEVSPGEISSWLPTKGPAWAPSPKHYDLSHGFNVSPGDLDGDPNEGVVGGDLHGPAAFLRGAGHSAAFGFEDEAGGALAAGWQKLARNNPEAFAKLYSQNRDAIRDSQRAVAKEYPGSWSLGEAAANLAYPTAAGARAASLGANLLRGAKTGAVVGGLTGIGENEDWGKMPEQALGDTLIGGVLGAGFGVVGHKLNGNPIFGGASSLGRDYGEIGEIAQQIEREGGASLARGEIPDAAKQLEYTTKAFHAPSGTWEGTTIEPGRLHERGLYSTPNPELANLYADPEQWKSGAPQIMPLLLRTKDYHVVDAKGRNYNYVNTKAIDEADEKGAPGVRIDNVYDEPGISGVLSRPKTVFITLKGGLNTVRSPFAKFDPAKMHLNDLAASGTAIAVPSALVSQAEDKMERARGGRVLTQSEKRSHASVNYAAKSPHKDKRCNLCSHFIPATENKWAACQGVKSPIAPAGYCDRFERK